MTMIYEFFINHQLVYAQLHNVRYYIYIYQYIVIYILFYFYLTDICNTVKYINM